jgi:hypothetical protein
MAEKFVSRFAYAYHALAKYSKTDTFLPPKLLEAASYYPLATHSGETKQLTD